MLGERDPVSCARVFCFCKMRAPFDKLVKQLVALLIAHARWLLQCIRNGYQAVLTWCMMADAKKRRAKLAACHKCTSRGRFLINCYFDIRISFGVLVQTNHSSCTRLLLRRLLFLLRLMLLHLVAHKENSWISRILRRRREEDRLRL